MIPSDPIAMEEDSTVIFEKIRELLFDEYNQQHNWPWVIGYSGGKDSTLVTHLVFEMVMSLSPSKRMRNVHIVANDTLVESPLVVQHMVNSLGEIENAANIFSLPIIATVTRPAPGQSFWVNLIGRGYPSPNRTFRWCTDRMKIAPTSRYITEQVDQAGRAILLLGVRRSESASRSATVRRYDTGERLHKHNDLSGCYVFRPIVELSTDQVWEFLALNNPPWGGTYRNLINLYRNASGGECPVITSRDDAPSCGTTSSRFGCWTCTVVEKDRSLEGFVESGYSEFTPLLDFRDWLVTIRNEKERRQARRRDGRITITSNGTFIPGPFTLQTRTEIYKRLRSLELEVNQELISKDEIDLIHQIWSEEASAQQAGQSLSVKEIKQST